MKEGEEMLQCHLKADHYEIETIVKTRINPKTHKEEYLVKFKGYAEKDNEWLGAEHFSCLITFSSRSQRGRLRKHRTRNINPGLYIHKFTQ